MDQVKQAVAAFEKYNCSQAIFTTFGEEFGFDLKTALKISSGFGGGIGRMGDTCGAVTGAVMIIGLKYFLQGSDPVQSNKLVYSKVQELKQRFEARHQTTFCKGLLGLDLGIPAELKQAQETKIFSKLCPDFVRTAAEILVQI